MPSRPTTSGAISAHAGTCSRRREHVVGGRVEDAAVPEFLPVLADEPRVQQFAGDQRAGGQDQQRHDHHRRAFVHVLQHVMVGARPAVERHDQQPPGVERREEGREHGADEAVHADAGAGGIGRGDDRVLRVVAGERRDAGQRQVADPHHRAGPRDQLPQPAHLAHVLLVRHRVDHRAGAQEQQRLEEGVGDQVEDRHLERTDAGGDEHVAELRTGGIGDHPLDVVLRAADGGGEQRGAWRR